MGFMRFQLIGRFSRWMSASASAGNPSVTPQVEYAGSEGIIYCDCNGVIYCGA